MRVARSGLSRADHQGGAVVARSGTGEVLPRQADRAARAHRPGGTGRARRRRHRPWPRRADLLRHRGVVAPADPPARPRASRGDARLRRGRNARRAGADARDAGFAAGDCPRPPPRHRGRGRARASASRAGRVAGSATRGGPRPVPGEGVVQGRGAPAHTGADDGAEGAPALRAHPGPATVRPRDRRRT